MCAEHAGARAADALASAYVAIAQECTDLAQMAKESQWEGAPWPVAPGAHELERLAVDCRLLAKRRVRALQLNLPERRHQREIPMDPDTVKVKATRTRQFIEEGLQELWPGRNSKAGITQAQWTALREVLKLLTPKERQAYILVTGRGWTHRLAAREMKTSAGNVYNYLTRAQDKIAAWQAEQQAADTSGEVRDDDGDTGLPADQ